MLRKLAQDLWVAERPLPIAVGDLGARMTVLRGASGAAAASRSIDAILAWDFERLIMSHGDVLERPFAKPPHGCLPNASHEPQKQVLTVRLDDQRVGTAAQRRLDEQITKLRLHCGVKVELRLFDKEQAFL